jgi:ribosomal protein S21
MILVLNGDIDFAIKRLARELEREGISFELIPHTFFCSRTERKKMKERRSLRRKKRWIKKLTKRFGTLEAETYQVKQRARYGPLIPIKKDG